MPGDTGLQGSPAAARPAPGAMPINPGRERTRPPPPTVVRPVSNAVSMLRLLSRLGRPATLTQISRALGLNVSTCYNILRTLVWEEFVEFEPNAKTYGLGFGMIPLVQGLLATEVAPPAIKEKLHQLATTFQLTITVWRPTGDRLVMVAVVENPSDLRIQVRVGQRLPLLMSASGRLLAGRIDDRDDVRQNFEKLKWARPLPFDRYWREVQQARERGWAHDDGYYRAGMCTIAVPVLNHQGQITQTLAATMFRGQHDDRGLARIAQDMLRIAQQLSAML